MNDPKYYAEFDENDYRTWGFYNLPTGYHWCVFDEYTGEYHLYAPDGRDLTILNEPHRGVHFTKKKLSE